jgi:hypothetical protein
LPIKYIKPSLENFSNSWHKYAVKMYKVMKHSGIPMLQSALQHHTLPIKSRPLSKVFQIHGVNVQ